MNMAQTRRGSAYTSGKNKYLSDVRATYVHGSAVPKEDIRRTLEEAPKKKLSHEARKNREKAHHMSIGYVLFLAAALFTAGIILINYLKMQSELTNRTRYVARLESQLNTMKIENDEQYNRILSSIDLEEIKRIAIGELGMKYAAEGQIVTYKPVENDYMRKVVQD